MLPREERQAIATRRGLMSISVFKEHMSLARAVDESEGHGGGGGAGPGEVRVEGGAGGGGEGEAARPSSGPEEASGAWRPPFILWRR